MTTININGNELITIPVFAAEQGPPGPAGGQSVVRQAGENLSGHRIVVTRNNNTVGYPNVNQPSDGLLIEGLTLGAALTGNDVNIQLSGEVIENSWNWSLGPVYCGSNGQLTQTAPSGVSWSKQIGVAISSNTLILDLMPTINLV